MNNKIYLPLMAVASGLLLFAVLASNTDWCITCGIWDDIEESQIQEIQECQYGTIDDRCMFEDEYYMITGDIRPLDNQFFLELNETCTNLDGKIWCNKG